MPLSISPDGHLLGAVGAHDQDAAARQLPAQVEEQADRAQVRPLQVVHHQQQWDLARQGLQHPGVLLEEVALLRA